MSDYDDRRRSERYTHRAHATLSIDGTQYDAHLINVSRIGALVAIIDAHSIASKKEVSLHIETPDGQLLTMTGTVAHAKAHYLGLECEAPTGEQKDRIEKLIGQINEAAAAGMY